MSTPLIVNSRQAFQANVIAGASAYWMLHPGIQFRVQEEAQAQGIALRLEPQTVSRSQLYRALELRFERPQDYACCYLFLDPERALVIWQALPPNPDSAVLESLETAALSLAGLECLAPAPSSAIVRPCT
ncbi:hypothetical protein ACMSIO_21340 [Pseudomonas benzopyrenica]|uniref:hypothetical protein n=1 Tax=Pseudomonas benzopyrenica TaxID=2993566 RepID=UPI0039C1149C